jgi:hypothetical protein
MKRGDIVVVLDYQDVPLDRRIWGDSGDGILVCTDDEYQRALATGGDPLYVGFPKTSIISVAQADESIVARAFRLASEH